MTKDAVGPWAKHKLGHLRAYLAEYSKIMASQVRKGWCKGYHYVDAFAGPGAHSVRSRQPQDPLQQVFNEAAEHLHSDEGQRQFLAGSPRVALETEHPFSTYVFVEKSDERVGELEKLQAEFKGLKIAVRRADCNPYLRDTVAGNPKIDWRQNRAIVFLDPFGMQVPWSTIERLAATKAIEVFINFPEAMAIQRLLLRSGEFTTTQRKKLDDYFGSADWYEVLYKEYPTLFGDTTIEKVEKPGLPLVRWYRAHLAKVFGFASKAALIRNTKNKPLYYLILASPKKTGIKIANHILSAGEAVV
jgi:three-Cys-motif partner protein